MLIHYTMVWNTETFVSMWYKQYMKIVYMEIIIGLSAEKYWTAKNIHNLVTHKFDK